MANIIKRVDGEHVTETWDGISCDRCGCGQTGATEPAPCRRTECGGTMTYQHREWERYVPGYVVVRCACGQEVTCEGFTSTCNHCGADYNWAGQALAPRCQWGEETGEHPADIARIK